MTPPRVCWLVWRDRALLATPTELGTVEAPTRPEAEREAARRWPGVPVLVQSAASARVQPVTAIWAHRLVRQPINPRGPRRGQGHGRP